MEAVKDEAIAATKSVEARFSKYKLDRQNDPNGATSRAKVAEARCAELEKKLKTLQGKSLDMGVNDFNLSKDELLTRNKELLLELEEAQRMNHTLENQIRNVQSQKPSTVPALDFKRGSVVITATEQRECDRLRAGRDAVRRECEALTKENAKLRENVRRVRHDAEAKIAESNLEAERSIREHRHNQKQAMKLAASAEAQLKRDTSEWETERRKLLRQVDTARMFTMQSSVEGRMMAKLDDQLHNVHRGVCHGA